MTVVRCICRSRFACALFRLPQKGYSPPALRCEVSFQSRVTASQGSVVFKCMVWHCVCRNFWSSVTKHSALHLSSTSSLHLPRIVPVAALPNKPPEPTPGSVTLRASSR
jgi:hypothetical protein